MIVNRKAGQILNCAYGHRWPLDQFATGYVKIGVEQTKAGNLKLRYTWASTREQLAAAPTGDVTV